MKSNKNLQLFLIPVLCGLAVLVAAIFAKNATVQKSMSVTETTTVACSSSNYSNRTSDSVCPSGYNNTGNNCTATPTYTYTCPNGGNVNEDKCVYAATRQYTCATDAVKNYTIPFPDRRKTLRFHNLQTPDLHYSYAFH